MTSHDSQYNCEPASKLIPGACVIKPIQTQEHVTTILMKYFKEIYCPFKTVFHRAEHIKILKQYRKNP